MKRLLAVMSAALFASGTVFAQSSVVVTPDSSDTSGSTVVVPGDVTTYVTGQEVPSVTYEGDIAVGSALPSSVEVYPVPSNSDYAYTIINKKRVIVNPHTHKIIEIVK
ncbi:MULTISPECIES: DUF1236 domain-containing protein [Rhizobium]|uniref:DUF1236 domain-containing protein n=1 Tax=Rhizobium tropici TaxID=398 RepID=A0A329Y6K4_RHITR|nr:MULTISPECIES: DUF1236 domain-containing protein [Rhizobium]MBB3287132.1 hypothetical protein [Rhizobium sp. BK252]MBB3401872.1 hypothetical protein [Rhizobium sp. BK289]MBB3414184.1 hypothetical protein [Rhizobium sp. BK284]MBB3482071.1 hypothetical protein [Rhizobium sp. BK347]MDK4718622.1 DUF1236 domain-containing protein [Rhizobium sp. CNPSo 3968]